MLQTINGIDLMLVIMIIGLVINVFKLNRECESYVEQIIEVSQDNYKLTKELKFYHQARKSECTWTNECNCKNCYIKIKPPKEFIPKCTAPDPMLCDCDDCWVIPTKYF